MIQTLSKVIQLFKGSQRRSLAREACASGAPWVRKSTHPRKCGNHVTVHRTPTPQAYQCKITQSTGMATQMQLEVISAGNPIATRVTTKD